MQTSKVYIHRNKEGMWEIGVLQAMGEDYIYVNKHEASTWDEAGEWVKNHYVA